MKLVKVIIEEHLSKEVEVEVNTDDVNEAMDLAEQHVMGKYSNGEIVLTADNYTGTTLVSSDCDEQSTEWRDYWKIHTCELDKANSMCRIVSKDPLEKALGDAISDTVRSLIGEDGEKFLEEAKKNFEK